MINPPVSGVANHQTLSLFFFFFKAVPAGPFTEACACSLSVHSIIKPDLLSAIRPPPLLRLYIHLFMSPFFLFQPIDVFLSFLTAEFKYLLRKLHNSREADSEVRSMNTQQLRSLQQSSVLTCTRVSDGEDGSTCIS